MLVSHHIFQNQHQIYRLPVPTPDSNNEVTTCYIYDQETTEDHRPSKTTTSKSKSHSITLFLFKTACNKRKFLSGLY